MSIEFFGPPAKVSIYDRACANQDPPFSKEITDSEKALKALRTKYHPDKAANKNKQLATQISSEFNRVNSDGVPIAYDLTKKCQDVPSKTKEKILKELETEEEELKQNVRDPNQQSDPSTDEVRERVRAQFEREKQERIAQRRAAQEAERQAEAERERERERNEAEFFDAVESLESDDESYGNAELREKLKLKIEKLKRASRKVKEYFKENNKCQIKLSTAVDIIKELRDFLETRTKKNEKQAETSPENAELETKLNKANDLIEDLLFELKTEEEAKPEEARPLTEMEIKANKYTFETFFDLISNFMYHYYFDKADEISIIEKENKMLEIFEIFKILVKKWSSNQKGRALFLFLKLGVDGKMMDILFDEGVDINFRDPDSYFLTPLMYSIYNMKFGWGTNNNEFNFAESVSHIQYAENITVDADAYVLKSGLLDDNAQRVGFRSVKFSTFKRFLDEGADVNARDLNGKTVLMVFISNLKRFILSYHGYVVELLLEAGVDVNAEDEKGNTVLDYFAIEFQSRPPGPEILKLLLNAGARASKGNVLENFMGMIKDKINENEKIKRETLNPGRHAHKTYNENTIKYKIYQEILANYGKRSKGK